MQTARFFRKHPRVLLGLGLLLSGSAALVYVAVSQRGAVRPVPVSARTPSPTAPSAAQPSRQAVDAYTVLPTAPKYLGIPAIGVGKTRIKGLGVDRYNQIIAPDNIFDAGWYKASAAPGQPGAMFVYGHVSSREANGIFHRLSRLKPGDVITVTAGNNTTYTYRVTGSKTYPKDKVDMQAVLSPAQPDRPGLNLMTCTGKIIKGTDDFDARLVVFASL